MFHRFSRILEEPIFLWIYSEKGSGKLFVLIVLLFLWMSGHLCCTNRTLKAYIMHFRNNKSNQSLFTFFSLHNMWKCLLPLKEKWSMKSISWRSIFLPFFTEMCFIFIFIFSFIFSFSFRASVSAYDALQREWSPGKSCSTAKLIESLVLFMNGPWIFL